jgi:hypothetical protein
MAGEALTNKFMLGSATLMLGPVGEVFDLNVSNHSVGMVKNVTTKSTPGFVELTQGVKNTVVYSVMNSNKVMISAEVYEYTSKNMAYSLGLDGSSLAATTVATTITTAMATTGTPAKTSAVLLCSTTTGFTAGDYVMVQVGNEDQVFARKVVSVQASTSITVNDGLPVTLPIGTTVKKANVVGIGSKADQPFLSAKIVGTLADGSEVAILIPKVRITSGISLAFKTDNYDNIPLELTVYDLVSTDTDYTAFLPYGNAMLLSTS